MTEDLPAAAKYALQQLDRAIAGHKELVNVTDPGVLRSKAMRVEHGWVALEAAADRLRDALNIKEKLT